MSHHFFIVSAADTPLYSLTHQSTRPPPTTSNSLASNLPTWSTSTFATTLNALSGASSSAQPYIAPAPAPAAEGPVKGGGQDRLAVLQIANASLDVIEDVVKRDNAMYLKAVDKFNDWTVSAFITPGNMKFILLHEGKNDDGIKNFFTDVWELYVKACLNPFQNAQKPIKSAVFDSRVRSSAKRYL